MRETSKALFGSAAVWLVPGALAWVVLGWQGSFADWISVGLAALFVLCGVAAQWLPLVGAIGGILVFAPIFLLQVTTPGAMNNLLWIIDGVICILLGIALVNALRGEAAETPAPEAALNNS